MSSDINPIDERLPSNPDYYFKKTKYTTENLALKQFYEAKRSFIYDTIYENNPKTLLTIDNKNPIPLFAELFSLNMFGNDKHNKDILCFKHKTELPCETEEPFMSKAIYQLKKDWNRTSFFSSKYNDAFFSIIPNQPDTDIVRPYCDYDSSDTNKEFLLVSNAVLDYFLSPEDDKDNNNVINVEYMAERINDMPTNDQINNIVCDCEPKKKGIPYMCIEFNQLLLPNETPVPNDIKYMLSNLSLITQTLKGYIPEILVNIFGFMPGAPIATQNKEYNTETNKNFNKIKSKFNDIKNRINRNKYKSIDEQLFIMDSLLYDTYGLATPNSTTYFDHINNTMVYMCNINLLCSFDGTDFSRQISSAIYVPIYKLVVVLPIDNLNNYYSFLFIDNGPYTWQGKKPSTANFYKYLEEKINWYWQTLIKYPDDFYGSTYLKEYITNPNPQDIHKYNLYTLGGKTRRVRKNRRRTNRRIKTANKLHTTKTKNIIMRNRVNKIKNKRRTYKKK